MALFENSAVAMTRPRSAEAHRKVLEAAVRLFSERGIDGTSMDAIASASGVSKATIYKHWPDKDRLALETMFWLHGLDEESPDFDSGNLREDLIESLIYQPAQERREMKERMMPHLIAYSARNQVFGKAWRERIVGMQRTRLNRLLQEGISRGELDKQFNFDTAIALLVGPMVYRHIFVAKQSQDKAPREFAEQVVDSFLRSFRVDADRRQPAKGRSRQA
jgi:AcrR family transcriptional regulator